MQLTDDQLTRIAAALWEHSGKIVNYRDLAWADTALGPGGRDHLWSELQATGTLSNSILLPRALAIFLARQASPVSPQLLWTLPPELQASGSSYLDGLIRTIESAERELLLMSPFIAAKGVAFIEAYLIAALHRGVEIYLIGHELQNIGSLQSQAVESLRREAERRGTTFHAYSANLQSGLLHAKIAVADRHLVVLGSANMTGPGMATNFEVGVILGEPHASEVAHIYDQLLGSDLVAHIFTTSPR